MQRPGYGLEPARASALRTSSRASDVGPRPADAVAVGQHGQPVGGGHGRQLVRALAPGRPDVRSGRRRRRRRRPARSGSCRRDGGASGSSATARTRGRSRSAWPTIWRRPGRANSSKLTHRRHRVAGQAEAPGCRRRTPKAKGLAGRMAICIQRMLADAVEHDLHEVEVAHAHAAAGDERVAVGRAALERGGDRGLVVAAPGRGRRPRSPTAASSASSVGRFESRIWPGPSGAGAVDQLVAGGQHADPGPAARRAHRRSADAGQHAEVGRRSARCPRSTTASPACTSSPAGRTAAARRRPRTSTLDRVAVGRSVCSTITTASAPAGIGAPVMIRMAWPGPTVGVGAVPAGQRADDVSADRGAAGGSSAARTAKPSIAVLANGGTASSARDRPRPSRSPRASASGTADRAAAAGTAGRGT